MVLEFGWNRPIGAWNTVAAAPRLPIPGMAIEGRAFRLGPIGLSQLQPSTAVLGVGTLLVVVAARFRAALPAAVTLPR